MSRRILIPAAIAAAALAVPGMASASTVADSFTNHLSSGSESLGTYHLDGYDAFHISNWDVDVTSKATWTADLRTDVMHDNAIRQGASTSVSRMIPLADGTIKISWSASGHVQVGDWGGASFSGKTMSVDATCLPPTLGSTVKECSAVSPPLYLIKGAGPLTPYVKLVLKTKFSITPEGAITKRTFSVGDDAVAATQTLDQGIFGETLKAPCGPVGSPISYRLSNIHYTPKVTSTQQPTVQVGLMDPVIGVAESPALYEGAFGPAIKATPAFDLAGSGHSYDFGDLLANNVKPTVSLPATFTGTAGQPIGFYAGAAGACAIETYEWKFSNGTTSYGAAPLRSFATAGTYDGVLTVTDESGMKAAKSFTVVVK